MSAANTKQVRSLRNLEVDDRRALLERVLGSNTFSKTERLSSFLSYICKITLSGRANELNEQRIGTAVFGRPQDYDSTVDGIVRPHATRLRQRLDEFFNGEGADEPVRIALPRGSYVPLFEPNTKKQATEVTVAPSLATDVDIPPPKSKASPIGLPLVNSIRWILGAGLLLLLLASYKTRLFTRASDIGGISSPTHSLWTIIFPPGKRTMVVPSDTGLVMWHSATNQSLSLNGYVGGRYLARSTEDQAIGRLTVSELSGRRYTSIVDLKIVKSLTQIGDVEHNNLNVQYARDLRPEDLKDGDVVLIGAPAANPWVDLFQSKMNFVFSDAQIRRYTILNRAPLKGEPDGWTSNLDDTQRVYGVIAFMQNLDGHGHALILEGTSSPGTECAWDFVSDDSTLRSILKSMKHSEKEIPYFQALVECMNLTGSSVEKHFLAWREMK